MELPLKLAPLRHSLHRELSAVYSADETPFVVRILLEHFIEEPRTEWVGNPDFVLSSMQRQAVQASLVRLLHGEPIQYVLSSAHFYGRDFLVSPAVLIPRRETEELVVWARDVLLQQATGASPLRIVDLGTGSGCIAITLDLELKAKGRSAHVQGVDVSTSALEIARLNAKELGSACQFLTRDILQSKEDSFSELHVILSNPPYVRESEKREMHARVTDFEPGLALYVSDTDPLLFYTRIADLAPHWLQAGGHVFLEINESFGLEVVRLFERSGFAEVELRKDMQGKDRMIRARLAD